MRDAVMSSRDTPAAARPDTSRLAERLESVRSIEMEILGIGKRCAAMPRRTGRTPEQILGYDDYGLPRRT
jgi:hypothetical protein